MGLNKKLMGLYDKNILAVVPARGGSKGIPKKNIFPILGKPLVRYTSEFIFKCDFIDFSVISTDDKKIGRISGLNFPFIRSRKLSEDFVPDYPVINDALKRVESETGKIFDLILMLQPTSPLRRTKDLKEAIKKVVEGGYDSLMSVSETDSKYHPFKQFKINNDEIEHWDKRGKKIIARQQLKPTFHKNGVVYVMTRQCIIQQKTLFGNKHTYLKITHPVVNIDTMSDISLMEKILRDGQS